MTLTTDTNGAKIRAVWDGSSSRRDRRIQPRVSTLGTDHPWRGALSGRKIESERNINLLCVTSMSQSPRPGLGPHHFLHRKSKSIFAVDGSPIGGRRLSDRNLASFGLRSASGRRSGRSCPHSLRSLQKEIRFDERYVWD
jgi:hypothetical protein